MKYERLILLLNLVLVGVCGGSIYYLATNDTSTPAEVISARAMLDASSKTIVESDTNPKTEPTQIATETGYRAIVDRDWMKDLFTPTPTPTPPPPTPEPDGVLSEAVYSWKITSLDEKTVEFTEERTKEEFALAIGGTTRESHDKAGRKVDVKLVSVDMVNLTCTLGFKDQLDVKGF